MEIISNKAWGMIVKTPLEPQKLSRVDAIAIHHMASPTANIKEVQSWHLNAGWRAFGYNYWVDFDGTVYEGRGYAYIGAGVEDQNDHIISIGFAGNYQSGLDGIALSPPMSDAQFNAGIDIIEWVRQRVPSITKVGGHKGFMATACPGDAFPLAEMISGKRRETLSVTDCTNELLWRGIITNQPLWNAAAAADQDIFWLLKKYYPYIIKNGGSVKNPLSVSESGQAVAILQKQGILSKPALWTEKALRDQNVRWLLIKMADYIN